MVFAFSFNVHGIMYVPDDGIMSPLERDVRDLASAIRSVKDEQEYLVVRNKMHQRTADSTKSRIGWWSILQGLMLIGVCGVQVFFIQQYVLGRKAVCRGSLSAYPRKLTDSRPVFFLSFFASFSVFFCLLCLSVFLSFVPPISNT